jgi:hypothetical protein
MISFHERSVMSENACNSHSSCTYLGSLNGGKIIGAILFSVMQPKEPTTLVPWMAGKL